MEKVRYPASVFRFLKKYPVRHCQAPGCGRQLTPRLVRPNKLEPTSNFKIRKTCSDPCMALLRRQTKAATLSRVIPEPRTWPEKLAERGRSPVVGTDVSLGPVVKVGLEGERCAVCRDPLEPSVFKGRKICKRPECLSAWRRRNDPPQQPRQVRALDAPSAEYTPSVREALRLFHDRYPGMTPHVAWQDHGEAATTYWLECLDSVKAIGASA